MSSLYVKTSGIDCFLQSCSRAEDRMTWAGKLAKPYRVERGKDFQLKDFDPADTGDVKSREHAEDLLQKGITRMAELQDKLYAQDRWAVLLMFQAMDAAGKDGAI